MLGTKRLVRDKEMLLLCLKLQIFFLCLVYELFGSKQIIIICVSLLFHQCPLLTVSRVLSHANS